MVSQTAGVRIREIPHRSGAPSIARIRRCRADRHRNAVGRRAWLALVVRDSAARSPLWFWWLDNAKVYALGLPEIRRTAEPAPCSETAEVSTATATSARSLVSCGEALGEVESRIC